jgi:hypothetical protein
LGDGCEIEIAVDDNTVLVRSPNNSTAEANIFDDGQQVTFGNRLHRCPLPRSGHTTSSAGLCSGKMLQFAIPEPSSLVEQQVHVLRGSDGLF